MTARGPWGSLTEASGAALGELGERDRTMAVVEAHRPGELTAEEFARLHPSRYVSVGPMAPAAVSIAAGIALTGRVTYLSTSTALAAGVGYDALRQAVCRFRADVKLLTTHSELGVDAHRWTHPTLEDVGLLRSLPGMAVVVPADAPTARAATLGLHDHPGPTYLRLARGLHPIVTQGAFTLGRAAELRPGSDLTIVAVGTLVTRGLDVAEELARVGVSTRVLDFASVKPFDEPAVLRAARDTGALLVLEEHSVLTGVGALVASTTAENYPVPVRRVGVPDVLGEAGASEELLDRYGLSTERIREEAWELLRARGKVQ